MPCQRAERAQGGMDMMVYTREVPSPLSTSSRGPQYTAQMLVRDHVSRCVPARASHSAPPHSTERPARTGRYWPCCEGGETGLFSTYRTQVVPAIKLFSAIAVAFTH
jgi:hypothetical protein